MTTGAIAVRRDCSILESIGIAAFRPLHVLISWPALFFFLTLSAMLFRPPDLHFYNLDGIALGLLLAIVGLRVLLLRQSVNIGGPITLPLLALSGMGLFELLSRPAQMQDWSTFAAKWAVPLLLYHVAQQIFIDKKSLQQLEIFLLLILGYLSLTAIFFLLGARDLIFPSFILDEDLGIHADRARGPFLQAVANGVSLTLLGLIALDSYRRVRLPGALALAFTFAVPAAILATKTRSVWVSFATAIVFLWVFSSSRRIRRACTCIGTAGVLIVSLACYVCWQDASFGERLEERNPVEFRLSMYRAGWEMFQQKPLFGWHADSIQPELAKRVEGFHQEQFFFHSSYLEVAVQHGLVGLALYLWILLDLFRIGRKTKTGELENVHFLDQKFRVLWPVLVGVYLLNASFVVMNYQFVNGLLFTLAGILAAQNRRVSEQFPV